MSNFLTTTEMARSFTGGAPTDITGATTIAATSGIKEFLCNTSGGAFTVTLPAAIKCANGTELWLVLTHTNTLTVAPTSAVVHPGDSVGATTNLTLSTQWACFRFQKKGSQWLVAEFGTP